VAPETHFFLPRTTSAATAELKPICMSVYARVKNTNARRGASLSHLRAMERVGCLTMPVRYAHALWKMQRALIMVR
jgi:hypothetical protein